MVRLTDNTGWLVVPRWPRLRPRKFNSWLMQHWPRARLLYPVRRGDTITVEGDQVYVVTDGAQVDRGGWVIHHKEGPWSNR